MWQIHAATKRKTPKWKKDIRPQLTSTHSTTSGWHSQQRWHLSSSQAAASSCTMLTSLSRRETQRDMPSGIQLTSSHWARKTISSCIWAIHTPKLTTSTSLKASKPTMSQVAASSPSEQLIWRLASQLNTQMQLKQQKRLAALASMHHKCSQASHTTRQHVDIFYSMSAKKRFVHLLKQRKPLEWI